MFPAALKASASSGVGAAGAAGLEGFDLCGGGAGPSPLTGAVPFAAVGAGASNAPGTLACGGGGDTGPSLSTSMGSDIMDKTESLFRSASLRFSGWVSKSRSALRREPWLGLDEVLERLLLCEEAAGSLRDL